MHGVHNAGFLVYMNGYADESCQIFLGHYKTKLPCWKLLFAWLSQQKELSDQSSAAQLVVVVILRLSISPRQSLDQKSRMGNGVAEIQISCLAGRGGATGWGSNSLSLAVTASGLGQIRLPVFPRCKQAVCIARRLHVLKNVYSKAQLVSVTIYLN